MGIRDGLSAIPAPPTTKRGVRVIHTYLDSGDTLLGTGGLYGSGHSEWLIRQALSGRDRERDLEDVVFLVECGFGHGIRIRQTTPRRNCVAGRSRNAVAISPIAALESAAPTAARVEGLVRDARTTGLRDLPPRDTRPASARHRSEPVGVPGSSRGRALSVNTR